MKSAEPHRHLRSRCAWPGVVLLLAAATQPLFGHHSFAAHYFEEKLVEVSGTVTEFDYRAPHAWVHFTVADGSGGTKTYAAEWGNPRRLDQSGVQKTTLRVGDVITVWGAPGRTAEENRLHLKRIERPSDGWRWGQTDARRR